MNDKPDADADREYRELLKYLFERHIRPRMPEIRERREHHMHDEWAHYLARSVRAARLARFIEAYCKSDEDVYHTITLERLQQTIYDVLHSEQFARRLMEQGGFEEVMNDYAAEIASGLTQAHLPNVDEAIMSEIGSQNPELELRLLVSQAKRLLERQARNSDGQFSQIVRSDDLEKRLSKAADEFERHKKRADEGRPEHEHPKKTRRWFKGLGQIGQGAALTIANVGLAASVFHLPVSPETQTWALLRPSLRDSEALQTVSETFAANSVKLYWLWRPKFAPRQHPPDRIEVDERISALIRPLYQVRHFLFDDAQQGHQLDPAVARQFIRRERAHRCLR